MQDLKTGEFKDLTPFLGALPSDMTAFERRKAIDAACAKAEPDPKRRGPVFEVGETLDIRGGRFRVHAIKGNRLYLDGIPSLTP